MKTLRSLVNYDFSSRELIRGWVLKLLKYTLHRSSHFISSIGNARHLILGT